MSIFTNLIARLLKNKPIVVRVVSDGVITQVIDTVSGRQLAGVTRVELSQQAGDVMKGVVYLSCIHTDVIGAASARAPNRSDN